MAKPLFSVVIPVLNEAATINDLLQDLQGWRPQAEIIVVDGGSDDGSAELARAHCDHVLVAARGRALQMNAGAQLARGHYLLFLHCDTRPCFSLKTLEGLLQDEPLWGFFTVRLGGRGWPLRLVEWSMNQRSRLSQVGTGDQLLFIRREEFLAMAGFAPVPLMEDVELCKRLRKRCPPSIFSNVVETSSRRWDEKGVWTTVFTMWQLRLGYWLGVSPQRLVRIYYG